MRVVGVWVLVGHIHFIKSQNVRRGGFEWLHMCVVRVATRVALSSRLDSTHLISFRFHFRFGFRFPAFF